MSDAEHLLFVENRVLREDAAELRSVARRAIVAAIEAQDASLGHHEVWLDEALTSTLIDAAGRHA